MRLQAKQFIAIAQLTALEAIRQPICLLVAASCVVLISLMPFLITHTLGESEKLIRDSALAAHFVCGLILGAYIACSTITREMKRGTLSTVLSKPVSWGCFFLAKFSGAALVILLFSVSATIAAILATRAVAPDYEIDWWAGLPLLLAAPSACVLATLRNYFIRRSFASGAFVLMTLALLLAFILNGFIGLHGARVAFGSALDFRILPADLLITVAIVVLTSIAVSLATRFDTVPTLSLCSVILMLGLMSDYLFGRHAADSGIAATLYVIVPNWQHFWVTDALVGQGTIPWHYVAWASGYGFLYMAGILCFGLLAFRTMEVKP